MSSDKLKYPENRIEAEEQFVEIISSYSGYLGHISEGFSFIKNIFINLSKEKSLTNLGTELLLVREKLGKYSEMLKTAYEIIFRQGKYDLPDEFKNFSQISGFIDGKNNQDVKKIIENYINTLEFILREIIFLLDEILEIINKFDKDPYSQLKWYKDENFLTYFFRIFDLLGQLKILFGEKENLNDKISGVKIRIDQANEIRFNIAEILNGLSPYLSERLESSETEYSKLLDQIKILRSKKILTLEEKATFIKLSKLSKEISIRIKDLKKIKKGLLGLQK